MGSGKGNLWCWWGLLSSFLTSLNLGFLFKQDLEVGFLTTAAQLRITFGLLVLPVGTGSLLGIWTQEEEAGELMAERSELVMCCLSDCCIPFCWTRALSSEFVRAVLWQWFSKEQNPETAGLQVPAQAPVPAGHPCYCTRVFMCRWRLGLFPSPGWHCARLKFKSALVWQVSME